MSVTVTIIEGPRGSGKTFVLHALCKAAVGRVLMFDEPDSTLFLQNPKANVAAYAGHRYDNIFLVGADAVKVMTHLVASGVIPFPFTVRFINLNTTEITADDYPTVK